MDTAVVLVVVVVACGGGGDDDGGRSGPDASSTSGDSGTSPDAPKPTRAGFVSIQSYDAMNIPGMPTRGGTVSAGFYTAGTYCVTTQQIGACDLARCTTTPPAGPASAGTITVTGATRPIALVPGSDKTYALVSSTTPLFDGGETITFAASGAELPAFMASVATPSKATIIAPAEPAPGGLLIVDRAQGFTVAWSGGGSGVVQIALFGPGPERLFCRIPASAGTATLPPAALAALPAGMGGFAMASIGRASHDAGDWAVDVSAYFNAVWPDASIVSGGATLR